MFHLFILAAAAASPSADDKQLNGCLDKAFTDPEFLECTGTAITHADENLNEHWRKLLRSLNGYSKATRDALIAEQRAWITFKDQSCRFYDGADFGTMHRTIIGPLCRLQVINERIHDLDSMIDNLHPEQ